MLPRPSASVFATALAAATASFLSAQQPLHRVTIDPPQSPPARLATPALQVPQLAEVRGVHQDAVADDQPDFAPLADVVDAFGNVVGTRPRGNPYVLAFVGGELVPERGLDPALLARAAADPAGASYGFVMLRGRMTQTKLDALRAHGLELLGTHTWQCVKARIPHGAINVAALDFVHWVGFSTRAQKLSPLLSAELAAGRDGPFAVYVNVFASDLNAASRRVQQPPPAAPLTGGPVSAVSMPTESVTPNGPFQRALIAAGFVYEAYVDSTRAFRGTLTRAQLETVLALDCVLHVEPVPELRTFHDQTMAMIGQDATRASLPGNRIPLGVIDTGIDSTPWHQDFWGKGFLGWDNTGVGAFEDGHGHGTHVCGTMFGNGAADARYRGAGPAVGNVDGFRVFVGRLFDNAGVFRGDPVTLYNAFSQDWLIGSVLNRRPVAVNNSWGQYSPSGWTGSEQSARAVDHAVYAFDQTYVFASGNLPPLQTAMWAATPGTAKNVITVGNVTDFWTGTDTPGRTTFDSLRGTADGRIKPDVVAPGDLVTSCNIDSATGYRNSSGTSMAAPHVTGMIASLCEYVPAWHYVPAAHKSRVLACAEVDNLPIRTADQGCGVVNSQRMLGNPKVAGLTFYGQVPTTGSWQYVEMAIPANVDTVRVVFTFIEPESSPGAAQARAYDVRLYMDLPPYSPLGNVGEFSMASGTDTVMHHMSHVRNGANAFCTQARGQTVRFKAYGQSVQGFPSTPPAKWSATIYYYTPTPFGDPTFTATPSATILQPGGQFTLTQNLNAHAGLRDFEYAHMWLSNLGTSAFTRFGVTRMERTALDGAGHAYLSQFTHPSSPFPALPVGTTAGGMNVGSGSDRSLLYTLFAPANSAVYTIYSHATHRWTTLPPIAHSICVDGQQPNPIMNLLCTTHAPNVWSNLPNATFVWTAASDVGCAGLDRLRYSLQEGAYGNFDSDLGAGATQFDTPNLASTTAGYYFNVRAHDRAGNVGAHGGVGPLLIDTVAPARPSIVIYGSPVSSPVVTIRGESSDTHSGVHEMRYGIDATNWTPWMPYVITPTPIDLSGLGVRPGLNALYAQVRDRAGNLSIPELGGFEYYPCPAIRFINGSNRTTVITTDSFLLEGANFIAAGVTAVQFGSASLSPRANHNQWDVGYFRILSETQMEVYPPQGLVGPSEYEIAVEGRACRSNRVIVVLVPPSTPILRTFPRLTAGNAQTIFTHHGNLSRGTLAYLVLSTVRQPSVLPGVVSLDIGANFSALILLSTGFSHDGNGVARIGPLPTATSMVGTDLHFQAVMVEPRPTTPLPVTDVGTTRYL